MMTPSELREYEFKGAGRNAYKADDVDAFFGGVAVAYEKMYRENAELVKRISMLADRLEQYKNDENEIKQAVLSAQKAADIIVKQAELSVEDTKVEAEAILAAAKGEADIIKSDAEKQAIADSDLLLSIARDKAEEIINKAKEEAHGILIAANDSASDTVGAATRTITSESIHYEMLKKEVSDFRASILAQYKAHIELISKLPELAAEEAEKVTAEAAAETQEEAEEAANETAEDGNVLVFNPVDEDEAIVEFSEDTAEADTDDEAVAGEEVVKTTLPYDFFEETSTVEFIEAEAEAADEADICDDFSDNASDDADDVPAADTSDECDEATEAEVNTDAADVDSADYETSAESDDEAGNENVTEEAEENTAEEPADIPITRGFTLNTSNVDDNDMANLYSDSSTLSSSLFDSIEKIDSEEEDDNNDENYDDDDEDNDDSSKGGFFSFFRHKK